MSLSCLLQVQRLMVADAPYPAIALNQEQVVSVSGPSGCGKTRLLRAIADLDDNEGEMSLRGTKREDIPAPQWRKQVMLIPADAVWWDDQVLTHFVTPPKPGWLEALGLDAQSLQWEVSRLSSGERQRLGLLRAMVNEPSVLLLDEPTANLDENNVGRVEAFLLNYLKQHRAAALWVSHDAAQRDRISNHQLVFRSAEWNLL